VAMLRLSDIKITKICFSWSLNVAKNGDDVVADVFFTLGIEKYF